MIWLSTRLNTVPRPRHETSTLVLPNFRLGTCGSSGSCVLFEASVSTVFGSLFFLALASGQNRTQTCRPYCLQEIPSIDSIFLCLHSIGLQKQSTFYESGQLADCFGDQFAYQHTLRATSFGKSIIYAEQFVSYLLWDLGKKLSRLIPLTITIVVH